MSDGKRIYSSVEIVGGLYRAILGREADEGGLAEYARALDGGCGVDHIASLLIHSGEFHDRLPTLVAKLA